MNRQLAVWALAALLAGGAPMARGQSAASDADKGDAGVAKTKPKTVRSKDAPSDVRDLDPAEKVPSEQTTDTGAPGAKKRKGPRKPAPSDVRSLDPTRDVPSEQNTDVGTSGAKRPKDSRKPAPSDVRELDPTRQVPGSDNQDGGRPGEPGRKRASDSVGRACAPFACRRGATGIGCVIHSAKGRTLVENRQTYPVVRSQA